MKKAWRIFSGIATALFSLFILLAIGIAIGKTANTSPMVANGEGITAKESNVSEEPLSDSIAIPGFEHLVLKARTADQKVNFYNPAKNTCYFEITMSTPDGTEIFHSGLLAPGNNIDSIKLLYTLEPGTYEGATLRYSCYTAGSMEELNGADIVFNLEVLP